MAKGDLKAKWMREGAARLVEDYLNDISERRFKNEKKTEWAMLPPIMLDALARDVKRPDTPGVIDVFVGEYSVIELYPGAFAVGCYEDIEDALES